MNDIKLAVGMLTTGSIKYQTVFCLIRMLKFLPFKHLMIFRYGSLLHLGRESIVDDAIKAGCTHVLFVDSDMYFEEDAAVELMKSNKDIIGADYHFKRLPLESTARRTKTKGNKVEAVGTGFLLVNIEVFNKLPKPWFFFKDDTGEDYWFCERAKEAGYSIYIDPTVSVKHIGDFLY